MKLRGDGQSDGADYPPVESRMGGPSALHVDEERGRTPALLHLPLALLGHFAGFLTVLAPDREGKRTQSALADLFAALEAIAVGALLEPSQRFVDLAQRLGLHLDERELDLVLDVRLGALGGVEHTLNAAARALSADVTHPLLHLTHHLAAAILEDLLQLRVPVWIHLFFVGGLISTH